MSDWINVEDRLPTHNGSVLCLCEYLKDFVPHGRPGVMVSEYYKKQFSVDRDMGERWKVRYWMDIPAIPEWKFGD